MTFADPLNVKKAFDFLFACGARDVSVGGARLWLRASQSEKAFAGAGDFELVTSNVAEPFHVLLGDIAYDGHSIPDLGVFVDLTGFTLDYRMGPTWDAPRIGSLFGLLRQLKEFGGQITVPWWEADGERAFLGELNGA